MRTDEIEPTLREVLAAMLSVEQQYQNGVPANELIAEVDSLYGTVDAAIDGWFAKRKAR